MVWKDLCRLVKAGGRTLNQLRRKVWVWLWYGGGCGCIMSRPERLYCWLLLRHSWKEEFAGQIHNYLCCHDTRLSKQEAKKTGQRQIDVVRRRSKLRYKHKGYEGE